MKGKTAVGDHTKKDAVIMKCSCRHEFQDQRYGAGNRVHNPKAGKKHVCTVCGTVKQ